MTIRLFALSGPLRSFVSNKVDLKFYYCIKSQLHIVNSGTHVIESPKPLCFSLHIAIGVLISVLFCDYRLTDDGLNMPIIKYRHIIYANEISA